MSTEKWTFFCKGTAVGFVRASGVPVSRTACLGTHGARRFGDRRSVPTWLAHYRFSACFRAMAGVGEKRADTFATDFAAPVPASVTGGGRGAGARTRAASCDQAHRPGFLGAAFGRPSGGGP